LYLETTLQTQLSMRTLSISATRSTSPSDEHREAQEAQEGRADREAQTILTEDPEDRQLFLPLISFPSDPQETLNQLVYPPYFSMATEPEPTLSSANSKST